MSMSYDDAVAAVTAPGERFETEHGRHRRRRRRPCSPTRRRACATCSTPPGPRGDDTFLVYEDERWTLRRGHGATSTPSARCSSSATASQTGDRVAIGMRNYPEWVIAFAAITSIGAVVGVAQRVVDRGRARLRPRGLRRRRCSIADGERVERGRDAVRPARHPHASACGLGGADLPDGVDRVGGRASRSARRCPTSTSTPTTTPPSSTRRARPAGPKGAVSTHRAVIQALHGLRLPGRGRPPAPARRRRGRRRPARRSSSSSRCSTSPAACR